MPVGVLNLGERKGRRHEIHKNKTDHERNSTPAPNETHKRMKRIHIKLYQQKRDKE